MTPYELGICLWYYGHVEDWPDTDAPIWAGTMQRLRKLGLVELKFGDCCFGPTPKLRAFIEALCNTPLPIQVWVIPQTEPMPISTEIK